MSGPTRTAVALAPDPVLARRDDLLDDASVGARLGALMRVAGGEPVRDCTRVRAKYRRGESLRVTFRLTGDRGPRLVSARMFTPGKALVQYRRAREAAAAEEAPRGAGDAADSVLFDEEIGTIFWVFPQDRKLRGLDLLTCPTERLRNAFGPPWVRSDLMAYTPEKAATVRCADGTGSTVGFAKLQTGAEGGHSVAVLRAARRGLDSTGVLRLPEAVGYLPDLHLALFTAAPGRPLNQLDRAAVPDAMTALGAALSLLHRQRPDGFAPFTRLDPERIATAGALVAAARPDLATLAGSVVSALRSAPPDPAPPVLLHGDLHPKNVLVHPDGVSLVDLDQAGAGPAAAELGGTLARLWCPRPGDEIDPGTAAAAVEALLDAYDRPPGRADLLWYAAGSLLVERAVRSVTRIDVPALDQLETVLATALRWVETRREDGA